MELHSQAFCAAAVGLSVPALPAQISVSYLVCSHACHVKSPANNAVVPSADRGREK